MYKCLVFTDLHLGVHNNNEIWLDASIKLGKEMYDCCVENDITDIVFMGDFFHERRSINVRTLNVALEFAEIFEGSNITLWLIVGNHDTYFKNTIYPHSLNIFKKHENIKVVDTIQELTDDVTLVPWNFAWNKVKTPYIMGHFDINGCALSENFTETNSDFEISDFKRFTQVFSGHFHTPSINDNINYIGSVMPFTFHDVDSERGYYILEFNNNDFDMKFFEFKHCPKYKVIFSDEEIKKDDINGNIVKLVFNEELSIAENEKLINNINIHTPLLLNTDFRKMDGDEDDESVKLDGDRELKTNSELMNEYIDKIDIPKYINEPTLKQMIKSLI